MTLRSSPLGFPVMLLGVEKPICHFSCFRTMHRPHSGTRACTHKRVRTRARALTGLCAHRHARARTGTRAPTAAANAARSVPVRTQARERASLSCCCCRFETQPLSREPDVARCLAGGAPSPAHPSLFLRKERVLWEPPERPHVGAAGPLPALGGDPAHGQRAGRPPCRPPASLPRSPIPQVTRRGSKTGPFHGMDGSLLRPSRAAASAVCAPAPARSCAFHSADLGGLRPAASPATALAPGLLQGRHWRRRGRQCAPTASLA